MRQRSITVQFYMAVWNGGDKWPNDLYPVDAALDAIEARAPEDRRMSFGRMHTELVANVTGKSPYRLLSVETVETGAAIRLAEHGAIRTHQFPDDTGPAEPTYVMFLEDNIVALVRLTGGPPAMVVSTYLGVIAAHDLRLVPIESQEVASQLERPDSEFRKLRFRALAGNAEAIKRATRLGEIFEAAETVSPDVEEITVTLTMKTQAKKRRARWWAHTRPEIDQLLDDHDALAAFEEARVGAVGGGINLLEEFIVWNEKVPVDEHRNVSEVMVVTAIRDAYRTNRDRIRLSMGLRP